MQKEIQYFSHKTWAAIFITSLLSFEWGWHHGRLETAMKKNMKGNTSNSIIKALNHPDPPSHVMQSICAVYSLSHSDQTAPSGEFAWNIKRPHVSFRWHTRKFAIALRVHECGNGGKMHSSRLPRLFVRELITNRFTNSPPTNKSRKRIYRASHTNPPTFFHMWQISNSFLVGVVLKEEEFDRLTMKL